MTVQVDELTETLSDQLEDEQANVDENAVRESAEMAADLLENLDESAVDREPEEIAYSFHQYLSYDDVKPESARSAILNNLASSANMEVGDLLTGSGSTEVPELNVEEIDEPDQFVTVEVEVVDIWDNDSDAISQVGLVRDETGRIKFKTWETSQKPILNEGAAYRLERVATNEWNDNMEISVNSETEIEIIDREIEDIGTTFEGMVVNLQNGSGLIQRCTEEGCNNALNNGTCRDHGNVESEFDLRVMMTLDNGRTTQDVHLNRELTEELTGIRLDEAQEMAKEALDTSVVYNEVEDKLVHEYLRVTGWTTDSDLLISQEVEDYVVDSDSVEDLVARYQALQANSADQANLGDV